MPKSLKFKEKIASTFVRMDINVNVLPFMK